MEKKLDVTDVIESEVQVFKLGIREEASHTSLTRFIRDEIVYRLLLGELDDYRGQQSTRLEIRSRRVEKTPEEPNHIEFQ